tara:strand:+ start:1215 stop:2594 length:1380 start_codon:yes stop_codon:yes gene_type:complete
MLFNSYSFLFLFLPLVVAVFFLIPIRRVRLGLIVISSFVFYGAAGLQHAVVLGIEIVWVYALTCTPTIVGNRMRLTACVVPVFAGLVYYKYTGFIVADVLMLNSADVPEAFDMFRDAVLPAGISFFTFQLAAFAFDRFRGNVERPPSLFAFAAYISFFPQLIAGPIVRYHEISGALANIGDCRWDPARISKAIALICFGLALKVLFADTLSNAMAPIIDIPGALSSVSALYVVLGYSFQIYFDFYGYSLVAIGLGLLFGFEFPANFKRPYEALNIRDFWRCWHITLSYWIRDYLFVAIGGSNHYVRNILIVFLVCGLWHGAGWSFIIWGLYHGILVVAYHWTAPIWDKMPALLQRALTFTLVSLGWSLFLYDFNGAKDLMTSLIGAGPMQEQTMPNVEMWIYLALSGAACFLVRAEDWAEAAGRTSKVWSLPVTIGFASLLVLVILFLDRSQGFIYFRF